MKTLIKTGLVCAAAMWAPAAAMADPAGCDAGEIVIKFTHVTAERGHPKGEAAAELQRQVNASLDGRACMEVYPNSTLYADNDEMLQALLDGDVHLAAPSFSKLKRISPQVQLFDLPFLFQDLEHVINFTYTDEATALLQAGQDAGFRGLGYWMNGMSQMTAVREVRMPEDLNGLHFRMQAAVGHVGSVHFLVAPAAVLGPHQVHQGVVDVGALGQPEGAARRQLVEQPARGCPH